MHREVLLSHRDVIDMAEYKNNSRKLEARKCSKHTDTVLTMGCTICYEAVCTVCTDDLPECSNGTFLVFTYMYVIGQQLLLVSRIIFTFISDNCWPHRLQQMKVVEADGSNKFIHFWH